VDYVAASFVQSAADVRFIRSVLDEAGGFDIKIISKLENQEGLNNYKEIIKESDGVMIARGIGYFRHFTVHAWCGEERLGEAGRHTACIASRAGM
jgi:hypothetical protein